MVMEIIEIFANKEIKIKEPSVACIGFFDGIHKGHQELIEKTKSAAKEKGILSACVTFHDDPWHVLFPEREVTNITPPAKRLKKIEAFGIERCYLLHFDKAMAGLSKDEFIELLKSLNIQLVVTGDDFKFAKKNEGDIYYLEQYIPAIICDMILIDGQKVASSTIEKAIMDGNMEFVSKCLGSNYEIEGSVIEGNQVGRLIGFPTANLKMDGSYIIPKIGVYAGSVTYKDITYKAIINVGHNPTLNYQKNISIEAYILDFDLDIYDQHISMGFSEYIRDELKFNSKEELIKQLNIDVETVRSK